MLLQAAADGQRRAPAATLAPCPGKREGGVIDIAKPDAVIDHSLYGAGDFGIVMRLKLADRKTAQHLAKTLPGRGVTAEIMDGLVHQAAFCGRLAVGHRMRPLVRLALNLSARILPARILPARMLPARMLLAGV